MRPLYTAEQSRRFDHLVMERTPVADYELMCRAGRVCFAHLVQYQPGARDVVIYAGTGNNGGDGYVVGRLLLKAGRRVHVLQWGDAARLCGAAERARNDYLAAGGEASAAVIAPPRADLVVDALFGSGLNKPLSDELAALVAAINRNPAPKLAVDIPSGLSADTGCALPVAVEAGLTVSFLTRKVGLYTAAGRDCCGRIEFDDLHADAAVAAEIKPAASLAGYADVAAWFAPRRGDTHKGCFGHVLVVGGNEGMAGAVRLAGEAALRAGAGLVSIATRPTHAALLAQSCPVLMAHGVAAPDDLLPLLERADVVAVGPGLGRDDWARALMGALMETSLPAVVDADALHLLAQEPAVSERWVLTPHPGEAAQLLGVTGAGVQRDRCAAAAGMQSRYGGVCVLKGAGSIVRSAQGTWVCAGGNPGLSTAGSGDVLSGVIAALLGQKFAPERAALLGVCLHAEAGDRAAGDTPRGLLATDLLRFIRECANPGP